MAQIAKAASTETLPQTARAAFGAEVSSRPLLSPASRAILPNSVYIPVATTKRPLPHARRSRWSPLTQVHPVAERYLGLRPAERPLFNKGPIHQSAAIQPLSAGRFSIRRRSAGIGCRRPPATRHRRAQASGRRGASRGRPARTRRHGRREQLQRSDRSLGPVLLNKADHPR